jgi:hypothetical protein
MDERGDLKYGNKIPSTCTDIQFLLHINSSLSDITTLFRAVNISKQDKTGLSVQFILNSVLLKPYSLPRKTFKNAKTMGLTPKNLVLSRQKQVLYAG